MPTKISIYNILNFHLYLLQLKIVKIIIKCKKLLTTTGQAKMSSNGRTCARTPSELVQGNDEEVAANPFLL